jgi:exodeoxyribonuclease VII large subunit
MTGNVPEWSVSELSGALKRTLEDAFGHVRLRGEISGYRGPHSSGHAYFALKDASAKIEAVIWRGVFSKLAFKPQEGLEVIAVGKITTFAGKSSYQVVIEHIEPAGVGALMALLEERKRKLSMEGLFDEARKQLLPYLPRVIGVVTSPTGSVIRDILHRLNDRFRCHVLVWPVRVQGETSAAEVTAAVRGFNALSEHGAIPRPDLLIVARGGGSLEDLWSFNEENVVRAVAESMIPVISAIGHETDWTLIDMAADRRAPTPTAAAEMAVPVRAQLIETLLDLVRRLQGASLRGMERRKQDVRSLARALPSASSVLASPRQSLDVLTLRLTPALQNNARVHEDRLRLIARRLSACSPQARLSRIKAQLEGWGSRLRVALVAGQRFQNQRYAHLHQRFGVSQKVAGSRFQEKWVHQQKQLSGLSLRSHPAFMRVMQSKGERLRTLASLIDTLSHQNVLARGYAIVRNEEGRVVRYASEMLPDHTFALTLSDGNVSVHTGTKGASSPSRSESKPAKPSPHQGQLF